MELFGALVEEAPEQLALSRRQGRAGERGNGPVEMPEAQIQGPARENHPCERVGRVQAPCLGSDELAQSPERRPVLARRVHRGRIARTDPGGGLSAARFQTSLDFRQPLEEMLPGV